jgi:hypothetical protein
MNWGKKIASRKSLIRQRSWRKLDVSRRHGPWPRGPIWTLGCRRNIKWEGTPEHCTPCGPPSQTTFVPKLFFQPVWRKPMHMNGTKRTTYWQVSAPPYPIKLIPCQSMLFTLITASRNNGNNYYYYYYFFFLSGDMFIPTIDKWKLAMILKILLIIISEFRLIFIFFIFIYRIN